MKILILGGTTEASELARLVADIGGWEAELSLAGRMRERVAQPIPVRVGGFGGAAGLAAYLRAQRVAALIDATHPFAAQMKRNAADAAVASGTPLIAIVRAEWRPRAGDRWRMVPDLQAAADALGGTPRRVLLTIGQQGLWPFLAAPQHRYLVRSIERPAALPERAEVITARGPFDEPAERALLVAHGIEVVVSKNSGGSATQAKLAAARGLGVEVVMVERPALPAGIAVVRSAAAALGWLMLHAGTLRGE